MKTRAELLEDAEGYFKAYPSIDTFYATPDGNFFTTRGDALAHAKKADEVETIERSPKESEAEEKAKAQAEAKAKLEAEEKAKAEAKAKLEAEEKAKALETFKERLLAEEHLLKAQIQQKNKAEAIAKETAEAEASKLESNAKAEEAKAQAATEEQVKETKSTKTK